MARPWLRPKTTCTDGFSLSVQASEGHYCSPRVTGLALAAYDTVEVGFPSERPEPWAEWEKYAESPESPTRSVYGWVPVEMVDALIASHGGAR